MQTIIWTHIFAKIVGTNCLYEFQFCDLKLGSIPFKSGLKNLNTVESK